MYARLLMYALWVSPVILQAGLIVIMLRKNLRRDFPLFFSYLVFHLASFSLQFTLYHLSYSGYFYSYWTMSIIGSVLGLAVMHEVFSNIFKAYDSLQDLAMVLFRWAAVVLVLVAIVMGASSGHVEGSRLLSTILALERSVRVMQCSMVLFLLLFASHLGLTSRHHVFGIALGFGVYAAVDLTIATLRAAFGDMAFAQLSLLGSTAYLAAVGLWVYHLRRPEPERKRVEARARTENWNYALANVNNPEPVQESFMAAVETAVERVLNKRNTELQHYD
jgi:hypothetical protein